VESILQGDHYRSFLQEMYGDDPDHWNDRLTGMARLRMITNYFTRMRFCTTNGKLALTYKALERPDGFSPWFELPRPAGQELHILFGHWAALEGVTQNESAIALDTGCVWGRYLTAFRLEDGQYFTTPSVTSQQ